MSCVPVYSNYNSFNDHTYNLVKDNQLCTTQPENMFV